MLVDIEKHRTIMVQILKDIFTDISLETSLGFKGGTAVYLLYNLPRFSVDLDFDLIKPEKADEVFQKISKIIKSYGKVLEGYSKHFTLFFLLSYEKKSRNIKVEISKRSFPNHYETKSFLGIPLKVLVKEDIFAHKLAALLERKDIAHRDIFDIWFFAKNKWDVNKELVELRTKMKFKEYINKCLERINKINEKYMLQGLGELLYEKTKKWTKEKLKSEVIFLLKARFT